MNALASSFNAKDRHNQFVSALAHETRSPLANIDLSVEMLQSVIKDEGQVLYLDIIMRNSRRINDLIIELLTYQHSEEMQIEEYSLPKLLVGGVLRLIIKCAFGKYIVQIEDNGCGISKVNLRSLFTTAFTHKPGGLGLGLPIIYDTLRSNHVGVTVESEEGKGTVFILLFDKHDRDNFNK